MSWVLKRRCVTVVRDARICICYYGVLLHSRCFPSLKYRVFRRRVMSCEDIVRPYVSRMLLLMSWSLPHSIDRMDSGVLGLRGWPAVRDQRGYWLSFAFVSSPCIIRMSRKTGQRKSRGK